MPIDPQAAAFIAAANESGAQPVETLSITQARLSGMTYLDLQGAPEQVARVEHRFIPGPTADLPVRIYYPEAGEGPFPAIVWYHGSGWVICNIEVNDVPARAIANRSGCVVIAVNYQKAPEHPFPVPLDDCFATLQWTTENAGRLGIDPDRIAVGGDSAGGNLAAAVALRANAEGGPAIAFQVLIYPVTNYAFDTESYEANAEGYLLQRESMRFFWDQYLESPSDGANPYASPLRAESLAGLPPAFVATAEFDPLLDEGEAYAARLADAGVGVRLTRYEGMVHGFFLMNGVLDTAETLFDDAGSALRGAMNGERSAATSRGRSGSDAQAPTGTGHGERGTAVLSRRR
ncbi:alpha/beta hydrolase [Agromyces bauzanensis]